MQSVVWFFRAPGVCLSVCIVKCAHYFFSEMYYVCELWEKAVIDTTLKASFRLRETTLLLSSAILFSTDTSFLSLLPMSLLPCACI